MTLQNPAARRKSRLDGRRKALAASPDAAGALARADADRKAAVTLYAYTDRADIAALWLLPRLVAPFAAALAYADAGSRARERRPLDCTTSRLPARKWNALRRAGLALATENGWKLRARDGRAGWLSVAEWGRAGFREGLPARAWLVLAVARMAGPDAPAVIEAATGSRIAGIAAGELLDALALAGWYRGALPPGRPVMAGVPLPDGIECGPVFQQARNRKGGAAAAAAIRWRGHETAEAEAARLGISRRTLYRRRQRRAEREE